MEITNRKTKSYLIYYKNNLNFSEYIIYVWALYK